MKKDSYNFSVFDNYKCDGQYRLEFTEETVNIVEEPQIKDKIIRNKNVPDFDISQKLV